MLKEEQRKVPRFQEFKNKRYNVKPNKEALIVAGVYGVFGLLWISLSDTLLDLLVKDIERYKQIQTYKGWIYVLITIVLIYLIVRKRSGLVRKAMQEMFHAYNELQFTCEELVATEEELKDQKKLNENIFEDAKVIIATWNEEGQVTRLNPFGQELFGYTEEEIFNKKWIDLAVSEQNLSKNANNFNRISQGLQQRNYENKFYTKDKRKIDIIWNNSVLNYQNKPSEILTIGTDITQQKILEEKLRAVAYYDSLTGLPNRVMIEDEVDAFIESKVPFAIFHINIDNFKQINDTLGHAFGDQFLIFIANKLRETIRWPNIVARLSADEFAIIYGPIGQKNVIEKELALLIQNMGKSWEVNHHEFFITSSIGISLFPVDGCDSSELFRKADVAMAQAKKEGKGRFIFYYDDIMEVNVENIKLANQLQYAIKNKELVLYYQPQFNLASGEITGLEALVRWIHPEIGFIPPAVFIPIAEDTGQIYEIERWIIETALKQKQTFEQNGMADLAISINLSSRALSGVMNFKGLEQLFAAYHVDYSKITIEVTETAIISDMGFAVERLKKLKQFGMKIALDDFGTGYSSLIHLKELPINTVKLDRDFIKNIEKDSKAALIIKAILYLTLDLDYEVVAEGIETQEQLEYLKKYKCQTGQGYLMSKPIPIAEIYQLLLP